MYGIIFNTRESKRVYGYLKGCGIDLNDVDFVNKDNYDKLKVIIRFGGKGVRTNHCYIKQNFAIPEVQVFDPSTTLKEPFNHYWIAKGIDKAKHIAKHGIPELNPDILLRPTMSQIEDFLAAASRTTSSFDIETDPESKQVTTFGVSYRATAGGLKSICIPLIEYANYSASNLWMPDKEVKIWELISAYLHNPNIKVMQNYIFDTLIMSRHGIETDGIIEDTMIVQHTLEPEFRRFKALSLADLARNWLYIEPWKDVKDFRSTESLWRYNARDAAYTLAIYENQIQELKKDEKRYQFYRQCLSPLAREVLRMCERGWAIDYDFLDKATRSLEDKVSRVRRDLVGLAQDFVPAKVTYSYKKGKPKDGATYCTGVGEPTKLTYKENSKGEKVIKDIAYAEYVPVAEEKLSSLVKLTDYEEPLFEMKVEEKEFNPASPIQVKAVCQGLGIKLPMKQDPKTGITKERTDKLSMLIALDKLRDKGTDEDDDAIQFLKKMDEFRNFEKVVTTYCKFTPDEDKKARFKIIIPGTVSSRFASRMTDWDTGFNSQNIPKSPIIIDGKKRTFRSVSVPHYKDWVILNMDFKQADPHMVSWLSGCQKMQDILNGAEGGDLHSYTASVIYGRDITKKPGFDKDTDKERKLGKIANNGLNYGMKPKTFMTHARKLGLRLTMDEAVAAYEGYHKAWPEVKGIWYENVTELLRTTRTLETPFGRKRYFFGRMSTDYEFYKMLCEALAYVPPTQVADALNIGNLKFLELAKKEGVRVEWLQQCHDSNKWQVHQDDLAYACKLVEDAYKQVLFQIDGQTCVFKVELEYGQNWGELQPWLG